MSSNRQKLLLSIRPEWCRKITNGEKTIEIRKSKPKLDTPFRCYIYCTKGEELWLSGIIGKTKAQQLNGKVIGQFTCSEVIPIEIFENGIIRSYNDYDLDKSCVKYSDIVKYIGAGKTGYGLLISDFKVFDKPRDISEFELSRAPQSWAYVE